MPMQIVRNDITHMQVDAIVNAANASLSDGGGGVDGCIHRAAGPELLAECKALGGCETGHAKLTKGYALPCRYIIHTVGPMTKGNPTLEQRKQLTQCYISCLDAACAAKAESVAFCCISTGVFGFPQQEGAQIAVQAVKAWLDSRTADEPGADMHVIFDVYTEQDENLYRAILGKDEKPANDAEE